MIVKRPGSKPMPNTLMPPTAAKPKPPVKKKAKSKPTAKKPVKKGY